MDDGVIGIEKGELFTAVAETAIVEVLAEDVGGDGDAGGESGVAGIEGGFIFDEDQSSAGGDDGVVGKVEGDAKGEANAGEVDGLGPDVHEFDKLEVIAIGGDEGFSGGGGFTRVVVDFRDDEVVGRGGDGVGGEESRVEGTPFAGDAVVGTGEEPAGFGDDDGCGGMGSAPSGRVSGEGEVEADVRADGSVLMNLDGDGIGAGEKHVGSKGDGFGGVVSVSSCCELVVSGGEGEVFAGDFSSVDVYDGAIVVEVVEGEVAEDAWVGDVDGSAEIGGGIFLSAVGAGIGVDESHEFGFITIAISELGRAGVPS